MPTTYAKTPLYGGAMTGDLPSNFVNVSSLRQVPDNQEVFISRTGLSSIIVEITERVEPPLHRCTTDEEALQYHYHDIIAADYGSEDKENKAAGQETTGETTKIWFSNQAIIESLGANVPVYTLFSSQHPQPSTLEDSGKPAPDFTGILLTLIRLAAQKTDVLITINVPHVQGEYHPEDVDLAGGKIGCLMTAAIEYRDRILQSFKIENWELFV